MLLFKKQKSTSKIAILFWCYKELDVCVDRLKYIKKLNPNAPIYVLYGGDLGHAKQFQKAFKKLVNDFYVYPHEKDSHWKWMHGDELILDWYREVGHKKDFGHLFIHQWDMLVTQPLESIYCDLKSKDVVLSGVKPVADVEKWWGWVSPDKSENYDRYVNFLAEISKRFGVVDVHVCLFIVACFPKNFMDEWVKIHEPEVGFLEYTIPTYAKQLGYNFFIDQHQPWWGANPETKLVSDHEKVLNAVGFKLNKTLIDHHLNKEEGCHIFHPFEDSFQ